MPHHPRLRRFGKPFIHSTPAPQNPPPTLRPTPSEPTPARSRPRHRNPGWGVCGETLRPGAIFHRTPTRALQSCLVPALDPQSLPRPPGPSLPRGVGAVRLAARRRGPRSGDLRPRPRARPACCAATDELAYLMTGAAQHLPHPARAPPRDGPARRAVHARGARAGRPPRRRTGPSRPCEAAGGVRGDRRACPSDFRLALVAVDIARALLSARPPRCSTTREATIATRVFRARQQVARKLAGEPESELAGMLAREEPAEPQEEREGRPPKRSLTQRGHKA